MLPPSWSPASIHLLWIILVHISTGSLTPRHDRLYLGLKGFGTMEHHKLAVSPVHSLPERQDSEQGRAITASLSRRTSNAKGFEIFLRHPLSAIIPGASGVAALLSFWQSIHLKALYNDALHEPQRALLTITEGVLQATFSSLGADIPWHIISDFAIEMGDYINKGLTDTFDFVFEQEGTGVMVWISLRVLIRTRERRNTVEPR